MDSRIVIPVFKDAAVRPCFMQPIELVDNSSFQPVQVAASAHFLTKPTCKPLQLAIHIWRSIGVQALQHVRISCAGGKFINTSQPFAEMLCLHSNPQNPDFLREK
jgi:hypothetical protein